MKKITVLLLLVITFSSCGEELVFNNPAFSAYTNDVLWEANTYRANVDAFGRLRVTGIKNSENIRLVTGSFEEGTYNLGNSLSLARYEDELVGDIFTTNKIPDPSIQLYPSEGSITISEFNSIERTVSGFFSFNAFNDSGLMSVNFNRGVFYNVPIESIATTNGNQQEILCANAMATTATTLNNLNSIDPAGPQYPQYCNAYKVALGIEITRCGDDGTIQAIIDGLGDCSN